MSYLTVLLTIFINRPDSSSDLSFFMMFFFFSVETINVVIREAKSEGRIDQNVFSRLAESVADAADFNPDGIK